MSEATDLLGLRARIEELRGLTLCATAQVELPVTPAAAWRLVGDPRRLVDLVAIISDVKLVPDGFRVSAAGTASVARVDTRVAGRGMVGRYESGAVLGHSVPSPELDGFWVQLEPSETGVRIEFGRAFRFKNRLAQQAGRALMPAQQRQLTEMASSAARLLAPGYAPGGPIEVPTLVTGSGPTTGGLNASDAERLRAVRLGAHKAAIVASAVTSTASQDPVTRMVGQAGVRATIWHADRALARKHLRLATSDDWPDLLDRLGRAVEPGLSHSPSPPVVAALVACGRSLGLSSRDDLTAGLGVGAFGYAVGELEAATYGRVDTRSVRKLLKELALLPEQSPDARLAAGAVAVARGRPVRKALVVLEEIPGFSVYVRELLAEAAGSTVDGSPDVAGSRSGRVRKLNDVLFGAGLAAFVLTDLAGSHGYRWVPMRSSAAAADARE